MGNSLIKSFYNIDVVDYNNYCHLFNNNWNLKSECIKYCELDCISLYQILIKFNNIIYDKISLNINDYPILPSLNLFLELIILNKIILFNSQDKFIMKLNNHLQVELLICIFL